MLTFITGCGSTAEKAEQKTVVKTPVTTTSMAMKPMSEFIELNAVSSFMHKNIVKASATSLVENSFINLGDNIEKGQVLFTLKTKEAAAFEKSTVHDSTLSFKGEISIRAQKSGIISSITHQKGDYVQEGDELAQLSEQNSLRFILQVPFELIDNVNINGKCQILLTDKRVISGVITRKLAVMDVLSQTESFVVEPLTSEKLPENLMVRISLIKKSVKNTMVLPKEAVLANETLTSFWVMKLINDSIAVKVSIKKGMESATEVEILEPAFLPSDRILSDGNYGLSDTALVSIKK